MVRAHMDEFWLAGLAFRLPVLMECNPSVSEECRRLMAATKPKQTLRAVRPKKPRS